MRERSTGAENLWTTAAVCADTRKQLGGAEALAVTWRKESGAVTRNGGVLRDLEFSSKAIIFCRMNKSKLKLGDFCDASDKEVWC